MPVIAAPQRPSVDIIPRSLRDLFGYRAAFRCTSDGSSDIILAEGVPTSEVSRWLGHKSITTTVNLYGHLVPKASGRARDALDRAFALAAMCPQSAPVTL